MNRKHTLTGANIVFFVFVVVFMLFQFVWIALSTRYGENFFDDNMYKILLVNQYIIILMPVLGYALFKKINIKEVFRLNKLGLLPAILIVLLSVPASFVALMLNNIVAYLLQFIGNISAQDLPVPTTLQELFVGLLVVAVSPAICEELLHRGVLLSAYERRGSIKAIVFTAIFFGIFHFDPINLLGPIFLGLLIGYYVVRTNSIFAGMLAHFMNNAIALVLQYLVGGEAPKEEFVTIGIEELGGIIIVGLTGLLFVAGLITLFKMATERQANMRNSISVIKDDLISIFSHWPIIVILVIYFLMTGLYLLTIVLTKMYGAL